MGRPGGRPSFRTGYGPDEGRAASRHLDARPNPRRRSKPSVPRKERRAEDLGQGDVSGIVGGEVLPQLPNPQGERVMRPTAQAECGEIVERFARPFGRNLPGGRVAPQDLKDLEVEKMRRMQSLAVLKQTLFDGSRGWRAKQDFEDGGSVDDDHLELRSSRNMRAGFRAGETGLRPARRARSSLTVGRSALSAISARR